MTNAALEKYDGGFLGMAPSLSQVSGQHRMAGSMALTAYKGVHRTAFGEDSVRAGGVDWPLAGNIDNCCYNAKAESWFSSLDAALSYSATLTLYCDRSPAEGGKVRLVVVE